MYFIINKVSKVPIDPPAANYFNQGDRLQKYVFFIYLLNFKVFFVRTALTKFVDRVIF